MSSKAAMLRKGREEAENLNNILPIFQKKAKEPSKPFKANHNLGMITQKSQEIQKRTDKLKKESTKLNDKIALKTEAHELQGDMEDIINEAMD